ncbi:hypothetical protein [Myxococcus virescens]|uniref:Uncharacterized protein n=1 Tax=Myxococcus virescens TaxID=83456 RepID=A0A511HG77_9BACT|nr:hypothetical protein [Myxococcus virescens]GEL72561.1 hypothetical protein MVI01_43450 [Myxococcus virescens]SDF09721.1 hypothetical protein SAMN04488504_1202 [Myxococcus virescens]
MTRNVKRFLAGSLLSLTPSIAFAGQIELDFPDFLTQRSEYVSVREGAVQLPVRKGPSVESIGPAVEDFFVSNQAGVDLTLGIQILTGTYNGTWNTHPVPPGTYGGFQVGAPAPAPTVVQQYYYTVDPVNPAGSKTCVWRVEVTDNAGTCGAQVFFGTYGGALCTVDETQSSIDPVTCQTQVVTNMQ